MALTPTSYPARPSTTKQLRTIHCAQDVTYRFWIDSVSSRLPPTQPTQRKLQLDGTQQERPRYPRWHAPTHPPEEGKGREAYAQANSEAGVQVKE